MADDFNCPSPHEVSGNHSHDHRCCNASVDLTDPKKGHFEVENLWKSGKYGKKMGKSSTNGKILGKSMEIYGRCVKKIGGKNMGNNGGKHDE